jgi:putative two-component system response regulator
VRRAAALHDIGKIGIPDAILLKPGKLTTEEFDLIKTHTALAPACSPAAGSAWCNWPRRLRSITTKSGMDPAISGLPGEAIPLIARIVALADVFDVLTHTRPYKNAWPVSEALEYVERESGRPIDPP